MDNYFSRELERIGKEIRQLKTAKQKSAVEVPSTTKSVAISIPLELNQSQTTASGKAIYRITSANQTYLVATLEKYYDDVMLNTEFPRKTRSMIIQFGKSSNNNYIVLITARGTGGPDSDVTTLKNGGSVTLTNTLTVRGMDDFSIERLS